MHRRTWIWGGGIAASLAALPSVYRRLSSPRTPESQLSHRSGPLFLHPEFHCKVLMRSGTTLSDGSTSAALPDAMACFPLTSGHWALLRNHELGHDPSEGAFPGGAPHHSFDPRCAGGVSRLVLDPKTLQVVSSNSVLHGTHRNCGGGTSPLGYLSCEESRLEGHGYVFLCSPEASRVEPPRALPSYGRFRHEAACVHPQTLRAYLTEDEEDGCLYRFRPHDPARPFEGTLEALEIPGMEGVDASSDFPEGPARPVDWVPISDPEARSTSTRAQAHARGAARFCRGEGIWLDERSVFFACTSGGPEGLGQIFELDLEREEIRLVAASRSEGDFAFPDNLTIAPWGDVIVAEDGPQPCRIRGVTRAGRTYAIAENGLSRSEIAGVCFSPDGQTLFCNLQADGLTLAVTGPFAKLWEKAEPSKSPA